MSPRRYLAAVALAFFVAVLLAALYFFFPNAPFSRRALNIPPLFVAGAPVAPGISASTTGAAPLAAPRTPPAGQLEYHSTTYRFSLFYPADLQVSSYSQGGGASTFVFQDTAQALGFQIFVVPYSASQVDAARFAADEPSGVRNDLENISVDGATAAAFYGEDSVLGPTREIWFIHGGYLFEVTAPKVDAAWLDSIISTLLFL